MGTETVAKNEEAVGNESPSDLELKISHQIEYYFGNFNLSRDKFLRQQITVDDGWVPLETMVKFNRLKKLSEDFNVITGALKKSPKQLMEVSEDLQKIRRRNAAPIPDDYRQKPELDDRTLYVKGFKKNITLDELLDFFKEHNVEHVFMRKRMKQNTKPFRGSVFATFETKDDCEKFLNTKGIKYCGTELLKERKKDYVKRKDEFYNNLREEKEQKKLKKAGLEDEDKDTTVKKVPEIAFVAGTLLKLINLDENCTREDIKEAFDPLGTLVYVDYSKGKPSAVIRFESGVASSILKKLTEEEGQRKIKIGSCTAVVSYIEGDDEKQYWKTIAESRAHQYSRFPKNQKSYGNKGRFKKWGKRPKGKEEKDGEGEEPPQKRIKRDPSVEKETSEENNSHPNVKNESEENNSHPNVKNESEEHNSHPNVKNESEENNTHANVKNESEENNDNKSSNMDICTDKAEVKEES